MENEERMIDKLVKVKSLRNRNSVYTEELAEEILEFVRNGGTVFQLCYYTESMPAPSTVHKWSNPNSETYYKPFAMRMREAEADREQILIDQCLTWSEPDNINATLDTGSDKGYMPNSAEVQKFAMCLANRQWLLAKLQPAKYGATPHKLIKLTGKTAADKLTNLLKLTANGQLSAQAAQLFVGLIKSEAEAGELKDLAESFKSLSISVDNLKQGGAPKAIEVANVSSEV